MRVGGIGRGAAVAAAAIVGAGRQQEHRQDRKEFLSHGSIVRLPRSRRTEKRAAQPSRSRERCDARHTMPIPFSVTPDLIRGPFLQEHERWLDRCRLKARRRRPTVVGRDDRMVARACGCLQSIRRLAQRIDLALQLLAFGRTLGHESQNLLPQRLRLVPAGLRRAPPRRRRTGRAGSPDRACGCASPPPGVPPARPWRDP